MPWRGASASTWLRVGWFPSTLVWFEQSWASKLAAKACMAAWLSEAHIACAPKRAAFGQADAKTKKCLCTQGTDTNAEGAEARAAVQTVPYFPSRQPFIQANTLSAKHSIAHVAVCGDDIFPVPCGNTPLAITQCSFTETSCR